MQTLNVGAGQTETEYQATEEKRRAELRADSLDNANYFFWAAGIAALGSGILPVFPFRLNILVNIGVIDLLRFYGRPLGTSYSAAVYGAEAAWLLILVGLGLAARKGNRWAFLAGIVLYAADMLALITMFSLWAFGVHAFFVFRWFQGQKALKDLQETSGPAAEAA
ncbi:MAG TPA: hypothetical protein VLT90_08470 [Terriglobales bacterium]|nr:hypothetical protein [Terriglobales bacterium]